MIKHDVKGFLEKELDTENIVLLTPKNSDHGDYSLHAKRTDNTQPTTTNFENELFSKIEKVGDFINFTINPTVLWKEVETILEQKDVYGSTKQNIPKRIMLEYGQPNTHKLPHIGHLFSYIFGESLTRILAKSGNEVYRVNYQGDIGLHVAKCLYIFQRRKGETSTLEKLDEKIQFLQTCYQEGSKLYVEDETVKKEIDELNKKIYEKDLSIQDVWQGTRQWSIDYYAQFEEKLGISYDKHYFESAVAESGKKIVQEHRGDVFEESEGAIIFPGEKIGLHNRVFINRFGNPTYEAKDVGLAALKYEDWKFDTSITATASEQNGYFTVVFEAIEQVYPELKGRLQHVGFGMIDLKKGKMSSRTGNIVSAVDLVNQIQEAVSGLGSERANAKIKHVVGLAAIKYAFLRSEARKNISFDIDESISIHGNSGPYLLYSYARAKSILSKSEETVHTQIPQLPAVARDDNNEERLVLRTLFKFPEVVQSAAEKMAPHLIATYLFDVAQKFNKLYESTPILKAKDDDRARLLALIQATSQIIKNGLYLLGIETLDNI